MVVMFRKITALVLAVGLTAPALAGSNLPLVSQNGQTRQLPAGTTLATQPSTTGGASLNIPQGTAPTSPNDGDIWTTSSGVMTRVNGATQGPLAPLNISNVWTASQEIPVITQNKAYGNTATDIISYFASISEATNTGTYYNKFGAYENYTAKAGGWHDNYGRAMYQNCEDALEQKSCVGGFFQSLAQAPAVTSWTATVSIGSPALVTYPGTQIVTGDQIKFTTTGALPTGITAGTTYYAIRMSDTTYRLATSITNAFAGTAISTSGTQSGIHTATQQTGVGNYTGGYTVSYGYPGLTGPGVYVAFEADLEPHSPASLTNGIRIISQQGSGEAIYHGTNQDVGLMIAAQNLCGNAGPTGCGFEAGIEFGENFFGGIYGNYPSTFPILDGGTYWRAYAPTGKTYKAGIDWTGGSAAFTQGAISLPVNTSHNGISWGGNQQGGEILSNATANGGKLYFTGSSLTYIGLGANQFNIFNSGTIQIQKTTVGNLPTCNAGLEGALQPVTDSNSATFNAVMSGGGSNRVLAYCNGTKWTVH